ncbi:MAG: site-specific integrase [Candidatus Bathyarchaeia archaeon]
MSRLTDSDKAWLLSFESGRTFYNAKMKNSEVTEKTYTRWLKKYSDDLGKTPDELLLLKPNLVEVVMMSQQGKTAINPNEADSVLVNYLSNDDITPSNKLVILTTVKSFYSANLRDLAKQTGKSIEAPERKQRTPTVDDCVKLESRMPNARNAFLLWFLESCPVRVGTLKQLKWKDLKHLDDKQVPYWIYVKADRLKGQGKGRYKKAKHIGFLHSYTAQKLEEYKKELTQKGIEYDENSPIFMSYHINPHGSKKGSKMVNFNDSFTDASILAFGDDTQKHFSPHDFRDVISTVLENPKVKANSNLAKPLVSHKATGIEASYANHKSEEDKPNPELLELFKMCLPFLIPETTGELKAELNQQKTENEKEKEQNEKRIKFLEQRLLDNGLSINKMLTDFAQLKAMVEETEHKKPEKVKID